MAQERLGERLVVVLRRGMQRGVAAGLLRVGIGAGLEQELRRLGVARGGGGVQRAQVRVVLGHGVRVGALGEQQLDGAGAAEEGGVVERREPVGRAPVDQLRVGGERAVQVLGPARARRGRTPSSGGWAASRASSAAGWRW